MKKIIFIILLLFLGNNNAYSNIEDTTYIDNEGYEIENIKGKNYWVNNKSFLLDYRNGGSEPFLNENFARKGNNSILLQTKNVDSNGIDNNTYGYNRSEIVLEDKLPLLGEHEFSFSVYFDGDFTNPDSWLRFFRLRQYNGKDILSFQLSNSGELGINIQNNSGSLNLFTDNINGIKKGEWIDFIVNIRPDFNNNGNIKVQKKLESESIYSTIIDRENISIGKSIYLNGTDILPQDLVLSARFGIYRGGSNLNHGISFDEIKHIGPKKLESEILYSTNIDVENNPRVEQISGNYYLVEDVTDTYNDRHKASVELGGKNPFVNTDKSRSGNNSIKLQTPSFDDNNIDNSTYIKNRSELVVANSKSSLLNKYHFTKFSVYFNDDFQAPDNWFSFYQNWQYNAANPPLSLQLTKESNIGGRLRVIIRNNESYSGSNAVVAYEDENEIIKGKWIDFIISMKGGVNNDGELQIWRKLESDTLYENIVNKTNINIGKSIYPDLSIIPDNERIIASKIGIYRGGSNINHELLYDDIEYTTYNSKYKLEEKLEFLGVYKAEEKPITSISSNNIQVKKTIRRSSGGGGWGGGHISQKNNANKNNNKLEGNNDEIANTKKILLDAKVIIDSNINENLDGKYNQKLVKNIYINNIGIRNIKGYQFKKVKGNEKFNKFLFVETIKIFKKTTNEDLKKPLFDDLNSLTTNYVFFTNKGLTKEVRNLYKEKIINNIKTYKLNLSKL